MIRLLKFCIAILLGAIALCGGCSAPDPPPLMQSAKDVAWLYEPDAIVLRIAADERLNEHEGEPSSLMLCVYELSSREGVDERLASPGGFAELLACGRFDDSVVTSRRLFSDPGQAQNLSLDREENVRWIAVVAGYFHGTPAHSARVVAVPVREIVEGWLPFFKDTRHEPQQTIIPVRLGPSELLGGEPGQPEAS